MATIDWKQAHRDAIANPSERELPIVQLVSAIDSLSRKWANDHVLREGIAQLILGAVGLLNGEHGPRLDMSTLDSQLRSYADRISYDLDTETWKD